MQAYHIILLFIHVSPTFLPFMIFTDYHKNGEWKISLAYILVFYMTNYSIWRLSNTMGSGLLWFALAAPLFLCGLLLVKFMKQTKQ